MSADGGGHDPLPFTLHAYDRVVRPLLQVLVPRNARTRSEGGRRAAHHAGAAPFTKQRTIALPDASVVELNVAISL